MPEQAHTPALYSETLQTKSNTYFFDVKAAKNGNKYLSITESHTKDGQRFRNTITVFGNTLEDFNQVFAKTQEQMK